MKTSEIEQLVGKYARVRITGRPDETVRILDAHRPPAYSGDRDTVTARRFLAGGYLDIPLAPADVREPVEPDAKLLRIIAIMEEQPFERAER
jgi:hypothetical protein